MVDVRTSATGVVVRGGRRGAAVAAGGEEEAERAVVIPHAATGRAEVVTTAVRWKRGTTQILGITVLLPQLITRVSV